MHVPVFTCMCACIRTYLHIIHYESASLTMAQYMFLPYLLANGMYFVLKVTNCIPCQVEKNKLGEYLLKRCGDKEWEGSDEQKEVFFVVVFGVVVRWCVVVIRISQPLRFQCVCRYLYPP